MKATLSKDGQYRIELRITRRVSIGELAGALASAYRGHSLEDGPLPTLTKQVAQEAIRGEMAYRGESTDGWADNFGMTETNARLDWAKAQVRRAYPELVKAEPAPVRLTPPVVNVDRLSLEEALEYADQMRRDTTVVGLPNWPKPAGQALAEAATCSCPRGESEIYKAHHRTVCEVGQCRHGKTLRADVTGDPIAACAKSDGGTEWGAFNNEGCTFVYDCAVEVANWSAQENEEAESTPEDPESTWDEMCRDHRDQEQPKDGCEECNAETDDDE